MGERRNYQAKNAHISAKHLFHLGGIMPTVGKTQAKYLNSISGPLNPKPAGNTLPATLCCVA
jgi:hypothetical protein